jgi:hypothetical protein
VHDAYSSEELTFDNATEPNGWPGALDPSAGVARGVGLFSVSLRGANTELKTRLRLLARESVRDMLQCVLRFSMASLFISRCDNLVSFEAVMAAVASEE